MRLPERLDKELHQLGRVEASTMRMTRSEGGTSTTSMTAANTELKVGDWLRVWSPQGDNDVHVVRSVSTDYSGGKVTITTEHAISLLGNDVIFEEMTPATISGNDDETKIGARQYINALLDQQTTRLWRLGRCDYDDQQGWSCNESTILSALENMMGALDKWHWTFDMDTLPWTLNVIRMSDEDACELRAGRNLSAISVTVDRTGMCTRIYPSGASGLTIEGVNNDVAYLEKNTDVWGVVSRVETESSIEDADLLKSWAECMLDRLSSPVVSVSATGLALSEATGEPLDRLTVGKRCRVPLPEYGTTIVERITELKWQDAIGDPESVSVTMGSNRKTTQGVLRTVQKTTGGSGSSGSAQKSVKNVYTIVDQTDTTITNMAVAKRINQTAISSSVQTADSINTTVARYEYDSAGKLLDQHHTSIKQNADWIEFTGKVKVEELNALKLYVERLVAGTVSATLLSTQRLSVEDRTMAWGDKYIKTYRTSINGKTVNLLGHDD